MSYDVRSKLRWATVCAICLAGGVSVGRWSVSAPKTLQRVENSQAMQATAKQESQAVTVAEAQAEARAEAVQERVRVVWRERVTTPEGGVSEREVELDSEVARLASEAAEARREVEVLRAKLEASKASARVEQSLSLVEPSALPDWRVSGLVGLSRQDLVYGASIERRVLGPVHAGVWGLSSGAVGLSVGFDF